MTSKTAIAAVGMAGGTNIKANLRYWASMKLTRLAALACLSCGVTLCSWITAGYGDTITYEYTGTDFSMSESPYTPSDNITGFLTFASPLAANFLGLVSPTAFSFSDSVNTITTATSTSTFILLRTDSSGNITEWNVELFFANNEISTCNSQCAFPPPTTTTARDYAQDQLGPGGAFAHASVINDPGDWKIVASVPGPIVGAGLPGLMLASLGWLGWRRRQRIQ